MATIDMSLPELFFADQQQEREEQDAPQCTKGWTARCGRAKGPKCRCACGGHNHGNPKADKTREHIHGNGAEKVTLPWDGDIVCVRTGDFGCRFNIPQAIVRHSPTGMEWGYGGSGPADFALNILYWFTEDRAFAERHYQKFKWEVVAGIPREGARLPGEHIRCWIELRRREDGQVAA